MTDLDRDAFREALANVDPDMHRRLVNGDWTIEQCKHCGLAIGGANGWVHLEGKQRLMHRCALDPYGFDAAPVGEPCSPMCNGYEHSDPHYQAATERWERNQ